MTIQPFWFALRFLTRIPVPVPLAYSPALAGRSLLAYPLVGLLLGLLMAVIHAVMTGAAAPLQAAVLMLFWVLITGALHLDGLADCADAWVGGYGSRERSFEILKDPRAGSTAIAVLVSVLVMKFAALETLISRPGAYEALLWTPLAGRSAALALLALAPYANPQGLASAWLKHLPHSTARGVLLAAAGLIAWRLGLPVLAAAILSGCGVWLLAMGRLGGVTGDVCGAAVELVEMAVLLAVAWR